MLKITFKDVGQGDTIILEWSCDNEQRIGVIDSHIYKNRNPALEHLKAHTNYKSIDFYILSHGHYDHYSGISEVLQYCEQKNIKIKTFYHTLSGVIVKIFSKTISTKKQKVAEKLIMDLDKYSKGPSKIIQKRVRIDNERLNIKLNDLIEINIVSPIDQDYSELEKSIGNFIGEKTTTYPNINKVSTILKIEKDNEYILLTSDALKTRIGRIEGLLKKSILTLAQVPHHGSERNHRKQFWTNVKRKDNAIAVFSTGNNEADKLPDEITVQDIHNLNYTILSTNQVNGLCNVFGESNESNRDEDEVISDIFDLFTDNQPIRFSNNKSDDLNGDQVIDLWSN